MVQGGGKRGFRYKKIKSSKKVLSSLPGQVDFFAGQVTFLAHFLNAQVFRYVCKLNHQLRLASNGA